MNGFAVAILTNGSAQIGLGHLRRCLSLAHALIDGFAAKVFFIVNEDKSAVEFVCDNGFETVSARVPWDSGKIAQMLAAKPGTLLVTDSYAIDSDFLSAIRPAVRSLIAIDDLAGQTLPVDVVVNGAANARAEAYDSLTNARLLIGPRYALLRKEFSAEPGCEVGDSIARGLINIGGSDPFDLTPRLIELTRAALPQAKLDVVAGPFFENVSEIQATAARHSNTVEVHLMPDDMRELMLRSDFAITGGGQTTYELAATATPALAICIAKNQLVNLVGLEREGTLVIAGSPDEPQFENRIRQLLTQLNRDRLARERMAAQGRRTVDGRGAERVASVIAEFAN